MLVYKYRHIKKKTKTTVKEMSTTQSYLPLRLIWHIVMDRIQTLLLNMVFWFNSYASKNACVIHKT